MKIRVHANNFACFCIVYRAQLNLTLIVTRLTYNWKDNRFIIKPHCVRIGQSETSKITVLSYKTPTIFLERPCTVFEIIASRKSRLLLQAPQEYDIFFKTKNWTKKACLESFSEKCVVFMKKRVCFWTISHFRTIDAQNFHHLLKVLNCSKFSSNLSNTKFVQNLSASKKYHRTFL